MLHFPEPRFQFLGKGFQASQEIDGLWQRLEQGIPAAHLPSLGSESLEGPRVEPLDTNEDKRQDLPRRR